jgi:nucleoside-triphosphatase
VGRAYLLTGRPGVGKTTCLRKVLDLLQVSAGGFFTEEIREEGGRLGFSLVTLGGKRVTLAHVSRPGAPRVGKYGVNLEALHGVGIPAIREAVRRGQLVVVDEIGRMEMTSALFRQAVEQALRSPVTVLGTVLTAADPWADRIKRFPAVEIFRVTAANRDSLPRELAASLRRLLSGGS